MKKIRIFTLVLSLLLVLASGCAFAGDTALGGSMAIPEDGVIGRPVFESLKADNKVMTFTGESGGCKYEWTVFGSDIAEPKALNLAAVLAIEDDGVLSVTFASTEEFGFTPVLSVYLNEKWNAQSATVFSVNGSERTALCGASVTGDSASILNFAVTQTHGSFAVAAGSGTDETFSADQNGVYSIEGAAAASTPTSTDAAASGVQTVDPYVSSSASSASTSVFGEPSAQAASEAEKTPGTADSHITGSSASSGRVVSDGTATEQDKYLTDPVPQGKPLPVEPDDTSVNTARSYSCIFSIECSTILNNLGELNPDKLDVLPSSGVILSSRSVTFYEGESVFDVLKRTCKDNGIHMEASWTPIYNSAYVEGINNLYEFDCGNLSGWMYGVNGWYPNYGCSRYQLVQGDRVEWRYTCDLGKDVGCDWLAGS